MIYAKYIPGRSLKYESRDIREIQTAKEAGFNVLVISSDEKVLFNKSFPHYELTKDGSVKVSYEMSRLKRYWLIFVGKYRKYQVARQIEADVVSCHDLDALCNFWLARLFKKHQPQLIYDSHEFELGRNKKRSSFSLWRIKHVERFMMKRCAFSIMVNDVIADEVQRIHRLKQRPVVVRNIPNYWVIDKKECINKRKELLSQMASPREVMLMYHGCVTEGRGIETLLQVVAMNDNVCLTVLGNSEHGYSDRLSKIVKELGVEDRVLFHSSVNIVELWKYVGAAHIGMITIPAIAKSYYYMLPNKFFENIQCETPVICSNYPAIQPLVEKYGVGLTCDPTDTESISICLQQLLPSSDYYEQCKHNARIVKEELCWEVEKRHLFEAFDQYLNKTDEVLF